MGYFDRAGQPMTQDQWDHWSYSFDSRETWEAARRVAKGNVGDIEVSTVWLGIDHSFGLGGPPIIFETMIFGGPFSQECARYATEAEALDGHRRTMEDLAEGRTPWFSATDAGKDDHD